MKTDPFNPCVLCYLPRPSFQPALSAFRNFTSFKTHYPLVFYTDSTEWPEEGVIKLKGNIDKAVVNSRYPNGAENRWAANNLCFWSGIRIASSMGYTHALYLEVDCRVRGDGWDKVVYDEFQAAGPGKVLAGTMLTYNASNKDFDHAKGFNEFVQANAGKKWPICSYGGGGCDEQFEPVFMANGALGIYDLRWIAKRFDINNTVMLARGTTAWDLAVGRELIRDFGAQGFKKAVHLDSVYSLYKDRLLNEEQRIELLMSGKVVAVHQIKSNWNPPECNSKPVASSVAELADAHGVKEGQSEPRSSAPEAPSNQVSYQDSMGPDEGSSPSAAGPSMSIFIVTHAKDFEWLSYCLLSVFRFGSGFKDVVVALPKTDEPGLTGVYSTLAKHFPVIRLKIAEFDQAPPPLGHLHHNIIKCRADEYSDADYILHMDSDCIFTESVTPETFMSEGKPVLLVKSWATIERDKTGSICWREPANRALGFQTTHETMQRQPLVYHRGLYPAVRRHMEALHGIPFDKYVLAQKNTYPCGFAEFNTLGSFAIRHLPDCYHIIDVGHLPHPHNPVRQYWSHGPLDKPQNIWHEGKLVNVTPIDEIKKILAL